DLLTDRQRLVELMSGGELPLREAEITEAHRFITDRVTALLENPSEKKRAHEPEPDDEDVRGETGIDGQRTEDDRAALDREDGAILLRAHELVRGTKQLYNHLFVDEAQDLSPLALSVLIGPTTAQRSITLAGDTAQRLFLDNGFHDWRSVLRQLALPSSHLAIEPLRIAYRSTREILSLARHA